MNFNPDNEKESNSPSLGGYCFTVNNNRNCYLCFVGV